MAKKKWKKYKFYTWLGNLVILLFLIGLIVAGMMNDSLYYIFLSEKFIEKYLGFLGLGVPLIVPIIGIMLLVVWLNLEVFYKDRNIHEKQIGTYRKNEKKRQISTKKAFVSFIFISLINLIVVGYLLYNSLFLNKFNSLLLENIMIIGFVFLPVNIGLAIAFGFSKNT